MTRAEWDEQEPRAKAPVAKHEGKHCVSCNVPLRRRPVYWCVRKHAHARTGAPDAQRGHGA